MDADSQLRGMPMHVQKVVRKIESDRKKYEWEFKVLECIANLGKQTQNQHQPTTYSSHEIWEANTHQTIYSKPGTT